MFRITKNRRLAGQQRGAARTVLVACCGAVARVTRARGNSEQRTARTGPFWRGTRSKSSEPEQLMTVVIVRPYRKLWWLWVHASRLSTLSIITSTNPDLRPRLAGVAVAARVNVTLDKLRAAAPSGFARSLLLREDRGERGRATVLKRRRGRHLRNICTGAGYAGYVLPRWESGWPHVGKNVTLFSYMVMQYAAHLEIYPLGATAWPCVASSRTACKSGRGHT